jgi:hypothetical protein
MRAEALTRQLGGRWHGNYGTARCPSHADRHPSLSLRDGDGDRLLLHCFAGCNFRDIVAAIEYRFGPIARSHDYYRAPRTSGKERSVTDLVSLIWSQTLPISGTHAERYLQARSITGPLPSTLRFHRRLRHPNGDRFPAMVGLVEVVDLGAVGLHRTYLNPDTPTKIDHSTSKAMLGQCKGGAVRLRAGSKGLAVAEGIETALSLALGLEDDIAVWAALSATGMAGLRLPPAEAMAARLIIGTDGEPRGRHAGADLADSATWRGWAVEIMRAPEGMDFNDLIGGAVHG